MRGLRVLLSCALSLGAVTFFSCRAAHEPSGREGRLQVVTTLFPLYDFARHVGGQRVDVSLLLPPGVEPHSFEPKPGDVLKINKADVFVYTGSFMEPWAAALIEGAQGHDLVVVDSSRGCMLMPEKGAAGAPHGGAGSVAPSSSAQGRIDPHIWLDLGNARIMVENILAAFIKRDPGHKRFYQENAVVYEAELSRLDERFRRGLAVCETRLFVHGGHYAFHYLARRYHLNYVSVYGFSPDAEPSPRHLAALIREARQHRVKYIFYEELLQPRLAETVAEETGAELLPLNGGHNVTKAELDKGETFISLLDHDLDNLRKGLQCR
jgi:zinc transport system substrate-binding protein